MNHEPNLSKVGEALRDDIHFRFEHPEEGYVVARFSPATFPVHRYQGTLTFLIKDDLSYWEASEVEHASLFPTFRAACEALEGGRRRHPTGEFRILFIRKQPPVDLLGDFAPGILDAVAEV